MSGRDPDVWLAHLWCALIALLLLLNTFSATPLAARYLHMLTSCTSSWSFVLILSVHGVCKREDLVQHPPFQAKANAAVSNGAFGPARFAVGSSSQYA